MDDWSGYAPEADFGRYRDYLRLLARIHLHRSLQARLDPSDIVQDVLLRAHENRDQLRGKSSSEVAGWLRAILKNVVSNQVRDNHREKRDLRAEQSLDAAFDLEPERLERVLVAEGPSPSSQAMREELVIGLLDGLLELPERRREVVVLHRFQGLPLAQVARRLDIDRGEAADHLHEGLKVLRSYLQDHR